mmetsp:Transcript_17429/g.28940  ORF Transcript_17429/g.28940 Transcript_17429/m.28940 type:complete len:468 (+) Transcript_17429:170-1573(+)
MVALGSLSTVFLMLSDYIRGSIRKDERIVFFPTIATQELSMQPSRVGILGDSSVNGGVYGGVPNMTTTTTNNNNNTTTTTVWQVPIHGWVFQPNRHEKRRKLFLTLLRRYLNISNANYQNDVLKRRMAPFLVDNSRNKLVRVRFDGDNNDEIHTLPRSSKNGHFYGVVRVNTTTTNNNTTDDEHQAAAASSPPTLLKFQAVLHKKGDTRIFGSQAHLVPSQGISIISDIDDTVKITNVTSRKSMLRNTFLEEFQPVPGMAQVFRDWQQRMSCQFHFVSSSPWQLYEDLDAFCQKQDFPDATFHLKSIRVKDRTLFQLFANPMATKTKVITNILEQFPERTFICVGDSGEKDPEVYGALARQYPNQIAYILIRDIIGTRKQQPTMTTTTRSSTSSTDVPSMSSSTATSSIDDGDDELDGNNDDPDEESEEDRMERAFARVPRDKWAVFTDASEIELPLRLLEKTRGRP